jgi:hypothetical protein
VPTNTPYLSIPKPLGNENFTRGNFNNILDVIDAQTKAKIELAISNLLNGAPGALDTLNELAEALGDDPNFAATIINMVNEHKADYVKHPGYGVTAGTNNAYTLTLNPAPTAYEDGMSIKVKAHQDSTASATLNINGLGAKALKNSYGEDVSNLKTNGVYTFIYNASTDFFILQGEGGVSPTELTEIINTVNYVMNA